MEKAVTEPSKGMVKILTKLSTVAKASMMALSVRRWVELVFIWTIPFF